MKLNVNKEIQMNLNRAIDLYLFLQINSLSHPKCNKDMHALFCDSLSNITRVNITRIAYNRIAQLLERMGYAVSTFT